VDSDYELMLHAYDSNSIKSAGLEMCNRKVGLMRAACLCTVRDNPECENLLIMSLNSLTLPPLPGMKLIHFLVMEFYACVVRF
jgi:hypothetical protein